MIKRLAHICLYSHKPEAMITFYHEVLGFEIGFTMQDDAGKDIGWYFKCGGQTFIEIFDAEFARKEWDDALEGMENTGRIRHICFEVDSIDECKEVYAKKGYEVFDISVGMDGAKQGWLIDPDGNWIELMEYLPGCKQLL